MLCLRGIPRFASSMLSPFELTASIALPLGCVTLVGGLFVYLFVIRPATSRLRAIPGPKSSHWLYGSRDQVNGSTWTDGKFAEPQLSWVKQYGGVVCYREFLDTTVMLTDPEALKHVFNTNGENYPRAWPPRQFLRVQTHHTSLRGFTILLGLIGGDGLFSTKGDLHTHQRKMLLPHFGFNRIKDFVNIFATHAAELCDELKLKADQPNVTVDLYSYFTALTLDVIGVSAFGYNFNSLSGTSPIVEATNLLFQPPSAFYEAGKALIPTFDNWPLPRLIKERQAKKMLYQTVDDVIAAKLKAPRDVNRPVDIVDLMLDDNAHAEHKVTAEEVRTHVMTFIIAGHETTSTTLSWVFTLFAQHPHIEALAREEARAATANGGTIGWKMLGELKYITACIQEALRLYPTISRLATRIAQKDDVLPTTEGKPVFVPKGTVIAITPAAMHRNPKYWNHPEVYLPERFIEGTDAFLADKALRNGHGNTYYYMPFSVGAKNCIGMRFAMAELQVVVATLLLQYSFRLTDQANVNPKMVGVSIKPVHLDMTVHSIA
ncbi:hypothetical protein AeMF1_015685 [Aphanomyces euteiches]|nr:hypothetical protein AeMF1_015685 [Aphanomyces euteiches]